MCLNQNWQLTPPFQPIYTKKVSTPARGLIDTDFGLPLNRGKCWGAAQWERGLQELSSPSQGGTQSLLSTPAVVVSSKKSGFFTSSVTSLSFREVDGSFPDLEWHVQLTPK